VDWLPLGGPHFGASGKINLALFDALQSMSKMSTAVRVMDTFASRAKGLREAIISHLWNEEAGILRMTDIASPNGICQDINAYSAILAISPSHPSTTEVLASSGQRPLAFRNLERWDKNKIISPYACGFAAEALFARNEGAKAVQLIEKVWGEMSNPSNPNYSGGHWEAMAEDGTPVHDDTSLVHGWSTSPVFLLPQYLAGLEPLEPGWTRWKVQPVLTGLASVDVQLSTPVGDVSVSLHMKEAQGTGEIILNVPKGTTAELQSPHGWQISDMPDTCTMMPGRSKLQTGRSGKFAVKINRISPGIASSSEGTSSLSKEEGAVEVVEDVRGSEQVVGKKSFGLRSFLKSVFGRCF
jgi:hypothetical protein